MPQLLPPRLPTLPTRSGTLISGCSCCGLIGIIGAGGLGTSGKTAGPGIFAAGGLQDGEVNGIREKGKEKRVEWTV